MAFSEMSSELSSCNSWGRSFEHHAYPFAHRTVRKIPSACSILNLISELRHLFSGDLQFLKNPGIEYGGPTVVANPLLPIRVLIPRGQRKPGPAPEVWNRTFRGRLSTRGAPGSSRSWRRPSVFLFVLLMLPRDLETSHPRRNLVTVSGSPVNCLRHLGQNHKTWGPRHGFHCPL